jgi:hypothetical protein
VGKVSKAKKKNEKKRWGLGAGSITYLLEFGRVLHSPSKLKRQTSPASFCDNIINHETNDYFLEYLFHVHYMMLDILIQENEGIIKFFTLMLKGLLEQSYGV